MTNDHPTSSDIFIGIIGGTGLGERLGGDQFLASAQAINPDTPFGAPSGPILVGSINNQRIALLARHGEGHIHNPRAVPYRANIFALKSLGVTHLIASGATGSLREEVHPGEIVLIDQFIDKTDGRPRTFFENAAVHVEFAEPCCPTTRRWLAGAAKRAGVTVHDGGTYVCMEGPAFSTRAESEMHRQWGGDVIGMTALPEARLAREAEMAYALLALPTDYDCWKPHDPGGANSLLEEIIGNLNKAADASVAVIKAALEDLAVLRSESSSAHSALSLAIWSDKTQIEPSEIERLRPIWGRYFDS